MDLDFLTGKHDETRQGEALVLDKPILKNNGRKLYIESYGCAMNFSDSEIVASILADQGFETTSDFKEA
ncbi:MAG: tRNA (N6-isopentenyl adenosine(37)-C2)-methylthiotransferase MiaB, partial [Sphingobacteriaceae bacterium]